MSRKLVGPFNRVEGDLEVSLDIQAGVVASAEVNPPLYRGFEQILLGHKPEDALVYTPRICGICSVSQSVACAAALADLMQLEPTPNGERCRNLVLANENIADLLTHFYLFFMPDFARASYADQPWFTEVEARFKATRGSAAQQVLPARAEFLHLMGLLAGKWPHTLSLQPGGSTKPVEPQERIRLLSILGGFRKFLERQLFGDDLEAISELRSVDQLNAWAEQRSWQSSDLRTLWYLNQQLNLDALGCATDQFMSYGNYAVDDDKLFQAGSWFAGERHPLNASQIREDLSHSWLDGPQQPLHPSVGVTQPSLDNPSGYSWCKAPRLNHQVVEVGALARQVVNGHPLARALVAQSGGNVFSRSLARLLEIALVVPKMQQWAREINPQEPFCEHAKMPKSGQGVGMIEAARGALGHWLEVEGGKIKNYQIIAPTTWNFSPRDQQGVPGALEQALVGTPVSDAEKTPVAVQHIVRSFDPCMVCTVH